MSAQQPSRGAAAVARLCDLEPLERRVVRCLRIWSQGPGGPAALRAELCARGGETHAVRVIGVLGELVDLAIRNARRPLLCHAPDCPCAGADETVFARFVALAAQGEREESVLIAALLIRADLAICLSNLAAEVGLALMRQPVPDPPAFSEAQAATRH
jgi:hypothetical protein